MASFDLTVDELAITNIELEASSTLDDNIIYFGETAVIKANISPQIPIEPPFDSIDWKTSNDQILWLRNLQGNKYRAEVVKVSPGTVNVWAQIGNVSSAPLSITVKKPTAKITQIPTNGITGENTYILKDKTTHQLGIDLNPSNITGTTFEWDSSNKNVATIDKNGKITTLSEGETIISYTVKIGGTYSVTDVFTLKVIHIDSVFIDGVPQYDLTVGESYNLTAKVYPYYSYVQGVTWSLDINSTVNSNTYATLDANGKLTLKSAGFITVFARSKIDNTVYDYFHVEIHPKAESIKITNVTDKKLNLEIDKIYQLQYNVTPNNVLPNTLKWKSSNEKVAKVNENGLITTIGVGVTYIEVFSTENENICDGFWLTVVYYYGDDHGDIFGESTNIGDVYLSDKSVSGHLGTDKDIDCFYFVSYRNCVMEIYSQGNTDTYASLHDEATNLLISDNNSQDDNNFKITYHLEAGKQYYLKINRFSTNGYIDYTLCFKFIKDFYVVPNNCDNMLFQWYNDSYTNYPEFPSDFPTSVKDHIFMNKVTAENWKSVFISNNEFAHELQSAIDEGSLNTIKDLLKSKKIDDFSLQNIGADLVANIIISLLIPYINELLFDLEYNKLNNTNMMYVEHGTIRIPNEPFDFSFCYEEITNYGVCNSKTIYGLENFRGNWNVILFGI